MTRTCFRRRNRAAFVMVAVLFRKNGQRYHAIAFFSLTQSSRGVRFSAVPA
jgi:hypothetical protein